MNPITASASPKLSETPSSIESPRAPEPLIARPSAPILDLQPGPAGTVEAVSTTPDFPEEEDFEEDRSVSSSSSAPALPSRVQGLLRQASLETPKVRITSVATPVPIESLQTSRSTTSEHPLDQSYEQLRLALDRREISAVELAREALRRAEVLNPEINSYISLIDTDSILKQAEAADAKIAAKAAEPITGIPLALKDLILYRGHRTTAGSKMLENFVAPYDATVTSKILQALGVVIGKSNLDEFAMGSSNESSHFGPCKNPWDLERVPGGSSGGSAAAVASKCLSFSLGTDTGGSIRQPAAMTGITGIKPTYGRVSRYGVVAYASSLDQVGPMCHDALGCAALLESISGYDSHDATSSRREVPRFLSEARAFAKRDSLSGLRIGLPKEFFSAGLSSEVEKAIRRAIEEYRSQGAEVVEISLPHTRFALPTYYLISTSEASSNLARYDGIHYGHRSQNLNLGTLEEVYAKSRGEGFGDETRLRILLGTFALSSGYYEAYYRKASQVRALIKRDFEEAFQRCDVIAGPTAPTTAFKRGEKTNDPLAMYLSDIYTLSTNLAALPGMSFNVGFDSARLPIGLQLLSPWWEESRILGLAAWYQQRFPQTLAAPPLAQKLFVKGAPS